MDGRFDAVTADVVASLGVVTIELDGQLVSIEVLVDVLVDVFVDDGLLLLLEADVPGVLA